MPAARRFGLSILSEIIIRSSFIEGKSPFSSNNGELVSNQEEANAAVEKACEAGYFQQIKIYNSMKGEWVPAMVAEARRLGSKVAGHVPAFSNAVNDAFKFLGSTHIQMPHDAWRIWQAAKDLGAHA